MPKIIANYLEFDNSNWSPEKAADHITEICSDNNDNAMPYFLGEHYASKLLDFKNNYVAVDFKDILKDDIIIFYVEENLYSGNIGKVIEPNKILENVVIQSKLGDFIGQHALRYSPSCYLNKIAFFRELKECSECGRKFSPLHHRQTKCENCK